MLIYPLKSPYGHLICMPRSARQACMKPGRAAVALRAGPRDSTLRPAAAANTRSFPPSPLIPPLRPVSPPCQPPKMHSVLKRSVFNPLRAMVPPRRATTASNGTCRGFVSLGTSAKTVGFVTLETSAALPPLQRRRWGCRPLCCSTGLLDSSVSAGAARSIIVEDLEALPAIPAIGNHIVNQSLKDSNHKQDEALAVVFKNSLVGPGGADVLLCGVENVSSRICRRLSSPREPMGLHRPTRGWRDCSTAMHSGVLQWSR
jgi:hypothetical protein